MKLKQLYAMDGLAVHLDGGIRRHWMPELEMYGSVLDGEVGTQLQRDGRIRILCVFKTSRGEHVTAEIHTVWFDSQPVMVLRDARAFQDRKVTDKALFEQMCAYIKGKRSSASATLDSMDDTQDVSAEEFLNFQNEVNVAQLLRAEGYISE